MRSSIWDRMDSWDENADGVRGLALFSNDIGTSLISYPDFVHLVCIDIPSRARTNSFSLCIWLVRIGVGYRAVKDEMCGFATVLVWRVVGIAAQWSIRSCNQT